MPTPDRTSVAEIVRAGTDILESAGLPGLTMQAVADRVGVRAPSLYKRVRNRDDLVRLITEATLHELSERLAGTGIGPDPRHDLAQLAWAFRVFAQARPMGYRLIFAPGADLDAAGAEAVSHAVAPVIRLAGRLAGERYALEAARTLTAWVTGFVGMELAGAFKLGGDIDDAFEFGIGCLAGALDRRSPS